jgi:transcriptional regulator with XRE-family HTH domain
VIRAQQLRIEMGLSVLALSEKTGVSRATITRLEESGRAGQYDVLLKLAKHFDVTPDDLLAEVGPLAPSPNQEAA